MVNKRSSFRKLKLSEKNTLVIKELVDRGYFKDKNEVLNHVLFTYFDSKELYNILKQTEEESLEKEEE
jgi:hypothetical protein